MTSATKIEHLIHELGGDGVSVEEVTREGARTGMVALDGTGDLPGDSMGCKSRWIYDSDDLYAWLQDWASEEAEEGDGVRQWYQCLCDDGPDPLALPDYREELEDAVRDGYSPAVIGSCMQAFADDELVKIRCDRTPAELRSAIRGWDREDIDVLRSLLEAADEMATVTGIDYDDLVDVTELPSEDLPDTVSGTYPIWAIDRRGKCLVGEDMSSVEPLADIVAYYADKNVGR